MIKCLLLDLTSSLLSVASGEKLLKGGKKNKPVVVDSSSSDEETDDENQAPRRGKQMNVCECKDEGTTLNIFLFDC